MVWDKYKEVLEELSKEFTRITEKEGWWSDDYSLWVTEFEAWSVEDMMHVVSNEDKLVEKFGLEGLRDTIEEWISYNIDVTELGINYINLKSWLMGCPRVSQEVINGIRERLHALNVAIRDCKDRYGELDYNPQPKHLRNIKHEDE